MDFNNFLTILPAFSRQEQKCKKKIQKKNVKKNFSLNFWFSKKKFFLKFWKKKFLIFFFEFFFTFSAAPQKIRTTGKKIMKIHQLEQILENFSKCPHDSPFWFTVPPRYYCHTFCNFVLYNLFRQSIWISIQNLESLSQKNERVMLNLVFSAVLLLLRPPVSFVLEGFQIGSPSSSPDISGSRCPTNFVHPQNVAIDQGINLRVVPTS